MASSSSSAVILNNSQSSLMASSSSSSLPRTWRYRVFTSFHGPDVRKTFLSHLRKEFDNKGIRMFDDQGIERGHTIAPDLIEAIRQSRISIVVLSKNYASSSWCLDELVEILDCKETMVMTVFYDVDPSDVRNQTGDFGRVFMETCARKAEVGKERWSQALNYIEELWDSEAKMIEKIARDVSDKLNNTPSRDFDAMVGLKAHLRKMRSLLDLDCDGVMMVGIYGHAGIGKTTIARALQSLISNKFEHTFFGENLMGSYHRGLDDHGVKLRLQQHLLSKIFNQAGTSIGHLGAIKERLCDLKVLIILDDVNDIKQLEALANETTWFGPGSRIIVTTENKKLLQRHRIHNMYHVEFPSDEEALEILCRYAFKKSYPRDGFENLAKKITELCGNLPLGLRVLGSCLQGENDDEWKYMIRRLKTDIDREIEDVLRIGYESLNESAQTLFLHIAVFFNHRDVGLVKSMLVDDNLDIEFGLKILVNRSLIYIANSTGIVMHKLLQQMGIQAINRQEPWKRRVLINAQDICDVFENDSGTGVVSGISFNTSKINEVIVSNRALQRMRNLRFLRVYKTRNDGNDRLHIPEEMEFPLCLRLLHWEAYPNKSLPRKFCLQNLVELNMAYSKLEKLWERTQPLTSLKKMDLSWSAHLKELPDLSKATNLKELNLNMCESLVELPSTIGNLQKLKELKMDRCESLEIIPTHINLASLRGLSMFGCSRLRTFPDFSTNIEYFELAHTDLVELPSSIGNLHKLVRLSMHSCKSLEVIPTHINLASLKALNMSYCSRLRSFPDFSTNIKNIELRGTAVEEVPASIKNWSHLWYIDISGSRNLKSLPHFPESVGKLDLSGCDIEKIPDSIHGLQWLDSLFLNWCTKLTSLPKLPDSLSLLEAQECESLQRVNSPLNYPHLSFTNCFKLGGEARRLIIQRSYFDEGFAWLPGKVMPSEFNHKARGNSLTIPRSSTPSSKFKACVMISANPRILCALQKVRCIVGSYNKVVELGHAFVAPIFQTRTEHLCIFHGDMPEFSNETKFEFQTEFRSLWEDEQILLDNYTIIIECGIRIITDEPEISSEDYDDSSYKFEFDLESENVEKKKK